MLLYITLSFLLTFFFIFGDFSSQKTLYVLAVYFLVFFVLLVVPSLESRNRLG